VRSGNAVRLRFFVITFLSELDNSPRRLVNQLIIRLPLYKIAFQGIPLLTYRSGLGSVRLLSLGTRESCLMLEATPVSSFIISRP
jgi:hypothetical protein